MTIPRPPSPLADLQFVVLSRGTTIHRVHRTSLRAAQFNSGLGEPTRFAHFTDGSGEPVPSLYASATLQAAIHETTFHDVPANSRIKTVRVDEVYIRTHSELETNRELRLVELRNVTLGNWGILRRDLISSSPAQYAQTVIWAAAIHRGIPDADGLVWTSNQCVPDNAYVFFGGRVSESDFIARRSRNGRTDKSFVKNARDEGRLRGVTLTTPLMRRSQTVEWSLVSGTRTRIDCHGPTPRGTAPSTQHHDHRQRVGTDHQSRPPGRNDDVAVHCPSHTRRRGPVAGRHTPARATARCPATHGARHAGHRPNRGKATAGRRERQHLGPTGC